MVDPLTSTLRGLMERQHARGQIAELMREHGEDFVIFTAQAIAEENRRKLYDAYTRERDAARAAATNPITSQEVSP